jgi:hypothetical protein
VKVTLLRGGSASRYGFLVAVLGVLGGADLSLFYLEEAYSRRDYSTIPVATLRTAYCMSATATPYEKRVIADSLARPPEDQLFAIVLPYALVGEVTPEKRAAMRALLDRAESRGRATQHAVRLANACGYDDAAWAPGQTPLAVAATWLQRDAQFRSYVESGKRNEPDAAWQMYTMLQKSPAPQ